MNKERKEYSQTGLEIAIIGMAGRFPGANNINEFWENLKNGVESISFFSKAELKAAGIEPDLLENPNFVAAKGVLSNVEYFDAAFFDYTPVDAQFMDPQIRIFQECAWEALENAGYDPYTYEGLIGLFAGASANFFWEALGLIASAGNNFINTFSVAQLADPNFLTTRVAYKLNLKGPTVTVNTACSTSLVAVHTACRELLTGGCNMALAGGVSISLPQKTGYLYQEGMIMSPDGHCRAFDAQAKGTAGGEGVGIVVLKRLEDALQDGDEILAVIKGTGVNNDGFDKVGFSAPSVQGQAQLLQMVYYLAEVEPETVSYIEAHGTGTILGDPIEIEALKKAFKTTKRNYCGIGSVKTNIGHLDAAAGIAGLIKTVLALQHQQLPPSLHYQSPNPKIDFEHSPFYVNHTLQDWTADPYPLRAGVSSFGIGGANAHVILEEAPPVSLVGAIRESPLRAAPRMLLISAKTASALDQLSQNLAGFLKDHPQTNLADLAYTLQVGRAHWKYRRALVCSNVTEAIEQLNQTDAHSLVEAGERMVIFMFPGQGSQYPGMGLELFQKEPVFRTELERCFTILKSLVSFDPQKALYPGNDGVRDTEINDTHVAQPLIFAFEYAMSRLLMEWGIQPRAMIGHSIGEYVAACLSGVFSLEDALTLVVWRAKLMQEMAPGLMLSVPLSEAELAPFLNSKEVSLAAVNSSSFCVVSGSFSAIETVERQLAEKGYQGVRLYTSHAFHSTLMEPALPPFLEKLRQMKFNKPQIPYISNVTGTWITVQDATSPEYWARHLGNTVRFNDGLTELMKSERTVFIEAGPGRTLGVFVKQHRDYQEHHVSINLARHPHEKFSDQQFLLQQLGRLWLAGLRINWEGFYQGEKRRRIPLPTYPFERRRYWLEGNPFMMLRNQFSTGPAPSPDTALETVSSKMEPQGATSHFERPKLNTPYIAPRNEVEEQLSRVWERLLGFEKVGIADNFFELGGDSLKALSLLTSLQKEFNCKIPLKSIFEAPTIQQLANFFSQAEQKFYRAIEPAPEQEYYPLSAAQRRLYFLAQLEGVGTGYNMPGVLAINGEVDQLRFEQAFRKLIDRHETLRTSFRLKNGEPVQQIAASVSWNLEYREESGSETAEIIRRFIRPFDLSQGPLFRAALIKLADGRHLLLFDMHHIISDGISMRILEQEFINFYEAKEPPVLRIQYKDYAVWQNNLLQTEAFQQQESFWLSRFSGEIPVLNLPTDYPRPALQSFEGDVYRVVTGGELVTRLNPLMAETGTTLFMVLLAAFNVLLAKYTGQDDVIIGSPISGRSHADLEPIIGMFVNTLALRNYPAPTKTFREFLAEVKESALQAYENQDYQFEELVEKLNLRRDLSRNPLFDLMFVLQNTGSAGLGASGLEFQRVEFENKISKFDLTVYAMEVGSEIQFSLEYGAKLFAKETIIRLADHFRHILALISRQADLPIGELQLLTDDEKQRILTVFNSTREEDDPGEKLILRYFDEQAARTPEKIALVFGAQQLTYQELQQRAQGLAHRLRTGGVSSGSIVAIIAERSLEMMIGILGILKAGGAYLPILPEYPAERIQYMLKDSDCKVLLTQEHLAAQIQPGRNQFDGEVIVLSDSSFTSGVAQDFDAANQPDEIAYVIYTSGSTGKPKGVMVEQGSVMNTLFQLQQAYPLKTEDAYLLKTPYVFDVSVSELLGWFFEGGRLVILEPGAEKEPRAILNAIERYRITHLNFVPSMLTVFLEGITPADQRILERLKYVFVAGEALSPHIVNQFYQMTSKVRLENLYGPTEATVYASGYSLAAATDYAKIPIGSPLKNTSLLIVNPNDQFQPIGIAGELYIGGAGLARGYLNNPELTAEKFVAVRFSFLGVWASQTRTGAVWYRTGDLARWLPDGSVEFLGRMDHQVKIRGFRIELGEIETRLMQHESITEAVVIAKEDGSGAKYLCAYFTGEGQIKSGDLRVYLAQKLPEYMLPAYFIQLAKLPLTASGKIDRKALADSSKIPEPGDGPIAGAEYQAPRNEIEMKLVETWQSVLGINRVGILNNFFELGGDSIKAIQVATRLYKSGYKLEMKDLFQHPRISELSQYIQLYTGEADQGVVEGEVPLTPIQRWFFTEHHGTRACARIGHFNQAVMLYREQGFDAAILQQVFEQLVIHHDALRIVYQVSDTGIRPWNRGLTGNLCTLEVSELDGESDASAEIAARVGQVQSSINLETGPLVKLALFKTGQGDHLLIAVHHLVIDGVSWRILFEDFTIGYEQAVGKKAIELPAKTTSFKDWAEGLRTYAASQELFGEMAYWRRLEETRVKVLPKDQVIATSKVRDSQRLQLAFTAAETEQLLTQVNQAYHTEMNDILLTALGLTFQEWSGADQFIIALEGHGREEILQGMDITRTVGWFTSLYPVVLNMGQGDDLGSQIKTVKEDLRHIPNRGIGYGILKYLTPESKGEPSLGSIKPEICFNYLGEFAPDSQTELFSFSPIPAGETVNPDFERQYTFDISGIIVEGQLTVTWDYNQNEYTQATVALLSSNYQKNLQKIIGHCVNKFEKERTPSDFSYKELETSEMESIFDILEKKLN